MGQHFENNTWVWIQGLVLGKALNGKLGEVVGFAPAKKRYMIFVPDLDENGFESEFLSERILGNQVNRGGMGNLLRSHKQDDDVLHKLFR